VPQTILGTIQARSPPRNVLVACPCSPETMISRVDVGRTCMDTIKSLGTSLHAFCREHPGAELVMWKSDIDFAYCNLWMAKEWQAKQTVTLNGNWYVNRCNCFGNRALYKVFLSFTSLVAWIAEHISGIMHLKAYVD
jgi:hypothetical protein